MNRMKNLNLVFKIKKEKTEMQCGGSSVNGICFNKIKFLKLLPSCKSVHPLQRSYLMILGDFNLGNMCHKFTRP